jgi:uncharacterized protein Yka (UPF0111/DUF47 family)
MSMTDTGSMTRLELIRLIGDVIVKVDELRSTLDRENPNRIILDNIRDELDTIQRKLVRSIINDNTGEFKSLTNSLKKINKELRETIDDADKIAQNLETLVKFVGVIQKIAELAPATCVRPIGQILKGHL